MRVIAGEFRGRILLGPESDITRPVTDRVKQSLFDILMPHIDGSGVYDCFAGTGSMGLECLSRGARHVTFFETDPSAVTRLRKNIDALKLKDRTTIVTRDLFDWFITCKDPRQIDLIFLDPPYRFLRQQPQALVTLAGQFQKLHLKSDGITIFRHDAADTLALPPLQLAEARNYGSMTLEFLRPTATGDSQLTTEK